MPGMIDEKVLATLLTPLRLASKALYGAEDVPDAERMGPAIGRAARYLIREGDTILIVVDDGTWQATDVHEVTDDEVTVEVYVGDDPRFYFETFPWDRVRLPWRHYDDHIQRMRR